MPLPENVEEEEPSLTVELPQELQELDPDLLHRLIPDWPPLCLDEEEQQVGEGEEEVEEEELQRPRSNMRLWDSVFEELPLELLVKIVEKLPPKEVCTQIRYVNSKWKEAAFRVMLGELRSLKLSIKENLNSCREKLNVFVRRSEPENLDEEMYAAARFSYYQIIDSEYRVLKTLFESSSSSSMCPLLFHAYEVINEIRELLKEPQEPQQSLREQNVSNAIENLRGLNTRVIDLYIWRFWDIKKDPLGPILFRLFNCSVPSKYTVLISHELEPKIRNYKCHLTGDFEMIDQSNGHISPPLSIQHPEVEKGARVLFAYICTTVRSGNLFHTLKLRWNCIRVLKVFMDRNLSCDRRIKRGWPLISAGIPPLDTYKREQVDEEILELRNGKKKIRRVFKKGGDEVVDTAGWLGIKCKMQMWCPIKMAPVGFVDKELVVKEPSEHPQPEASPTCTIPYLFKLELKSWARALEFRTQGIVETSVWVEESLDSINISQTVNSIQPTAVQRPT